MFKYKKCKMTFRKRMQDFYPGEWKEVSDAYLTERLLELKQKHDFEIISFKFNDCIRDSVIVIKCEKEYKTIIFTEFISMLGNKIENVKIY